MIVCYNEARTKLFRKYCTNSMAAVALTNFGEFEWYRKCCLTALPQGGVKSIHEYFLLRGN